MRDHDHITKLGHFREKTRKNVLDFSDMEHFGLNTDEKRRRRSHPILLRKNYLPGYEEVMDEYQTATLYRK